MKDDRTKYSFTDAANEELTFFKEDREEVFRKIRQAEKKKVHTAAYPLFSVSRKLAPLTISLLMVGLSLFLFFPSLFDSTGTETTGTAPVGEAAPQEEEEGYFTALFSIKDEEDRVPLNLLLAYDKKQKRMNILSIMRDAHMEMPNQDDPDAYKKLSHAYLNGSKGAESVKAAVSDLFDLPVDYYAVMDLETFSAAVDSVDGIVYDLPEDVTVRAISQVAFELEKGRRNLSGEEVVALLMDATVEKSLGAEDQLNLINSVIDQTIKEFSAEELKRYAAEMESNIPEDQLSWSGLDQISVQLLTLSDGMQNTMIDETFYIEFDEEFLHAIALELTTFD